MLQRPARFLILTLLMTPASSTMADTLCSNIDAETPRKGDLECVQRWLDVEQSWPDGARDQAAAKLTELRSAAETLSEAQLYLGIAEIVALADNGHTGLSLSAARAKFGLLPIRFFFFDDGLFIVRATKEHRRLLGAEVLSIGGRSPKDLTETMQRYVGGPAESFRAYAHRVHFVSPALLHAAGVTESSERVNLELRLSNGKPLTVDLSVYDAKEKHPGGFPWRFLHPDPIAGEDEPWLSWSAESGAPLPWALDEPRKTFRYRFQADQGLAHIQFRANISSDEEDLEDFLDHIKARLKADKPTYLLWDQRWNSGGDLSRTADFARRVHRYLPKDGHVFVATSNATFSAGIYTAFFPEWVDDERTTVIGTRVGDRERFWSESRDPISLPNLGWRIYYSLQMHDLSDGCQDRERCHLRKKKWKIAVGSFDPEVEIPLRSTDHAAGRDPIVDHVVGRIQDEAKTSSP